MYHTGNCGCINRARQAVSWLTGAAVQLMPYGRLYEGGLRRMTKRPLSKAGTYAPRFAPGAHEVLLPEPERVVSLTTRSGAGIRGRVADGCR